MRVCSVRGWRPGSLRCMTTPPPYGEDPYQQSPAPYPYPGGYAYDPVTGQPYSDKTKLAAGLLQLLPGLVLALGGIGRLYIGHTGIGVAQLAVSVFGWLALCCGAVLSIVTFGLALVITIPVLAAAWLWAVIDGILLLAGRPVDAQGRLLR